MTEAKPPPTTIPPVPQIGQLTARRGADLLIPPEELEQLSRQAGIHAPHYDYKSAAQQLNSAVFCTLKQYQQPEPCLARLVPGLAQTV